MPWSSGYQLRILKGNQQGLVVPLIEQVYILGRATSQGETAPGYMFFYEPTVSRVHAELRWNEKKKAYFVHHQSKTNPTLVEGLPVDKKSPRMLEKGNKIQMGYLILEVEAMTESPAAAPKAAPAITPAKQEESAKTHKMMVGNILEALSNLSAERNTGRLSNQPRSPEPEKPSQPASQYLERDYGASEQTGSVTSEIQFTVAQGPDQGEVFVLREQVGIIGRALGRDDPRKGQGVLLHDDSLPKEAAYVVWQNRDQAYGLSESDNPGVAIRVRRVQQGNSRDLPVSNGPPLLLQDGDVIQLGRSSLVCRVKGGAPLQEWGPPREDRRSGALGPVPVATPAGASHDWAGPPSPWGRAPERPSETAPSPPTPRQPVALPGNSPGGIVPRNFPGNSGALNSGTLTTQATTPGPAQLNKMSDRSFAPDSPASTTETSMDTSDSPTMFRLPKPPTPPRVEPTLFGRSSTPAAGQPIPLNRNVDPPARPAHSTPASNPPLDPSTAPTLGVGPPTPQIPNPPPSEERNQEMVPLSWPWRDNSDFVFDFTAGPNRGRQIALNANEMADDRVITLGANADQFDIALDGASHMAAIRYRSRRFALLNQGPDDSVLVNRMPLKRGDQVVLMTGDRIDIGETIFRYLERTVVEILQGFQIVVESGVDQDQDKVYPFSKQRLLIGRGKNCDIRLNDLEVSRIHVALVHRDGKFFVQHRSETNPTFLNGMSLLQGGERLIQPGDRVRLSSLTLLQFAKAEPRKRNAPTSRR